MIEELRKKFNAQWSEEKYQTFLDDLNAEFNYKIPFRVAESPVFLPDSFVKHCFKASEQIIDFILRDDFKTLTQKSIPSHLKVPGDEGKCNVLALDFACCKKGDEFYPYLIEMQGFPSLFIYLNWLAGKYKQHYEIPQGFTHLFSGLDEKSYLQKMKRFLLNGHAPENVILLEVEPEKQGTAVDFWVTERETGVKAICISKIIKEGRQLFYELEGRKIEIKRIYNRVIFDEFSQRTDLKCQFNLTEEVDVEWVVHPHWFFRVSKYTMPFIKSPYIPESTFVSDLKEIPADLENYVLKPLFSFSGTGVKFHVKKEDFDEIPVVEKGNWMLQKKVQYAPAIQAPDGGVKYEIRLLFIWENDQPKPELVINLGRLSRGEMIGVKFNKDKTWVGGNIGFWKV